MHPQKRKPVDVWSLIKSPYGIMIVISVFFIVVMPRLKVRGSGHLWRWCTKGHMQRCVMCGGQVMPRLKVEDS